jgi:hypothetical protein
VNRLRIRQIEVMPIGRPAGYSDGAEGEFLVTPLHTFPDYRQLLGEHFVGLRGGPVYAVLVRVTWICWRGRRRRSSRRASPR